MFFGRKENAIETTTLFYRQMAAMIASGVSIQDALIALGDGNENNEVEHLITSISSDISAGETPGNSLTNYPDFIKKTLRYFISMDSKDSQVSLVLNSIADDNEKMEVLRKKVKSALFYPAAIMLLAFFIMGIIMIFVIPTFSEMFSSFGASLPAPTQLAILISNIIVGNLIYLIALFIILVLIFKFNTSVTHRLLNILPGIGKFAKYLAIVRFLKYLSLLLSLKAPLKEAIESASASVNNVVYAKIFSELKNEVSEGNPLSDILKGTGLFNPMIIRMLKAGEKIEATDSIVNEVAGYYEQKLGSIENYIQAMDFAIMILIGTIIGGLVVSMYLPIFQLAGAVG